MKQIKEINNVSFRDHDEINNEMDMFHSDCESECHQDVSDMLAPGYRNKLISWLKNFGLMKPKEICKRATVDRNRNDLPQWKSDDKENLCQWQCGGCSERESVRGDSKFTNVSCSVNNAIKILLEWCKGNDIETVANMLGIKEPAVTKLYIEASNVAEKCMTSNIADWQLGGPGVVVIIDSYPEGCTNTNPRRVGRPILCISEIKCIPQKYWLQTLNHFQVNNMVEIAALKEDIIRTVRTIVRPGSILITPWHSTLCSHSDFDCLRMLYPTIVNTRDLARHDDEDQTLFSNLETIWKSVLDVCEVAQYYSSSLIPQFIIGHLWRQRYAEDSLELLLYELSSMQ